MNIELRPIFGFVANDAGSVKFFHELIRHALLYKFQNLKGWALKMDGKLITEAIFGLSDHDVVLIWEEMTLNGKELKELFITSIFLQSVERANSEKNIYVALPPSGLTESYDTAIVGVKKGTGHIAKGKIKISNQSDNFLLPIQVKEHFSYKENESKDILMPKSIDIKLLRKLADSYKDFVLIYLRNFERLNSEDVKSLVREGQIGIIMGISAGDKIPLKDSENKITDTITAKDEHYNFLLFIGDEIQHLFFRQPDFFTERPPL